MMYEMKYGYRFLAFNACLFLASGATGCQQKCAEVKEKILDPIEIVTAYLKSSPSTPQLAHQGCALILNQFSELTNGADTIRWIAEEDLSHTQKYCVERGAPERVCDMVRETGRRGEPMHRRDCRMVSPCLRWEAKTDRLEGYENALRVADCLDRLNKQAFEMCSKIFSSATQDATSETQALLQILQTQVEPDLQRSYAAACE